MNTVPLFTLGEDTRETDLKDTAEQNLSLPASDTRPSIQQCFRRLNLLVDFHMTTKRPVLKLPSLVQQSRSFFQQGLRSSCCESFPKYISVLDSSMATKAQDDTYDLADNTNSSRSLLLPSTMRWNSGRHHQPLQQPASPYPRGQFMPTFSPQF